MTALVRPRRSALFMPGSNARAMGRARSLPADAAIFDLEDAAAPDTPFDTLRLATGGADDEPGTV